VLIGVHPWLIFQPLESFCLKVPTLGNSAFSAPLRGEIFIGRDRPRRGAEIAENGEVERDLRARLNALGDRVPPKGSSSVFQALEKTRVDPVLLSKLLLLS